jgi:hypothetical protein
MDLASGYGSSFSDLLIDDENDPRYKPAPWDEAWGDNKTDHFNATPNTY